METTLIIFPFKKNSPTKAFELRYDFELRIQKILGHCIPMETAFRPISHTILFCGTKNSNKLHYQMPAKYLSTSSLPSLSLTFPSKYAIDFGRKTKRRLRFNGFISASSSSFERDPSQQLAVLLEVEGSLILFFYFLFFYCCVILSAVCLCCFLVI